jgi:hypothetical protein
MWFSMRRRSIKHYQFCAKREREKAVDQEQQQDETNSVTTLPGKDERRGRGDPKLAQRPYGK